MSTLHLDRGRLDLADIHETVVSGGPAFASIDTRNVESTFVDADRRRIGQVVRNLLDNALRHAPDSVRIATTTAGDAATTYVADDGPGNPPEDRQKIFERFVRLDEGGPARTEEPESGFRWSMASSRLTTDGSR